MEKPLSKPVSQKQFCFFGGITLVLLSLVMIVNMWIVARAMSFVFTYLFGIVSYFVYLLMLGVGGYLIVKKQPLKLKLSLKFIGGLLTFTSLCLLLTAFLKPAYNIEGYAGFFKGLDYIKNPQFINLFTQPVAGGLLGICLYEVLFNISAPVPYIIGFLILFVGLTFIFMNPILALFANYHAKEKAPRVKKNKKKPVENKPQEVSVGREYTYDAIKNASAFDDTPQEASSSQQIPVSQSDFINSYPRTSGVSDYTSNGVFTPAHFVPGVVPGDNPSGVVGISQPAIPKGFEKVEEPEPAPQPMVQPTPAQPERSEQLTLDFDSKPEIDPRIVTAQPVFEEPVAAANTFVNPAPMPAPAPVVKKPIKWVPPSGELLETYETSEASELNIQTAEQRTEIINKTFGDFGIGARVIGYTIGPAVTRYNIEYDPSVTSRNIDKIVTDISIRLGGVACRFQPIVEGSFYSGLEVPNAKVTMVSFKDVYEKLPDVKKNPTAIAFGKNINGDVIYENFNSFPHLLVAGTTGSGKSIFVHSIISTLIMRNSPENLKLVLIDPKRVEFVKYRDIPHLLCPIINDPHKAKPLLDKLVEEMNRRYDVLAEGEGFQDIKEYNAYAEENGLAKIPTIIAIVDEFGDLVQTCKEISQPIVLIGQKARACGIHLLIATQSPTSDIITGSIKSNLPTHVALSTSNFNQSVTIIGEGGAEKLLGKGDMLVDCATISRQNKVRLQGCYIAGKEIGRIANYLREHYETQYDENFLNLEEEATQEAQVAIASGTVIPSADAREEERYQSIKGFVMGQQYTSISKIQRDCSVGFNRAGRFFNRLVAEGIVASEPEGNKGSRVLVHDLGGSYDDSDNIPVSDELTD